MDTTFRRICFHLHEKNQNIDFSKYEYVLYFLAQINRFTHDDTGFSWKVMKKSLGLSNDIVNYMLYTYNTDKKEDRKLPAPMGDGHGRPMLSYSTDTIPDSNDDCWGVYISTNKDLTATVFKVEHLPIHKNKYNTFEKTDVILSFKSTSTIENLITDAKSQMSSIELHEAMKDTGIVVEPGCKSPKAFVQLLMTGWRAILRAIKENIHKDGSRLFITGHSLGGALSTIFGFILAEGQKSKTLDFNVKSIHVLSFAPPRVFNEKGKDIFNEHLKKGTLTYDFIVNQAKPTLHFSLLSIPVKNDWIPGYPLGYKHPGFEGDLYSIDDIRKHYGVKSETRYRDQKTWPFSESIDLYKNPQKLKSITKNMMGGGHVYLPNMVSLEGRPDIFFVHAEMMGMINKSAHRTYGMKNPVRANSDLIAYFLFCSTGVKIQYLDKEDSLVHFQNKRKNNTRKMRKN